MLNVPKTSKVGIDNAVRIDLLVIAVIWIIAIILVNPLGNFPLNDDWSFGRTVQRLVEQGRYAPLGWAAMPLLSNVVLGWFFSLPFGFSFEALRLSTLSLALIGLFYVYWLIRSLAQSRWLALYSAIALAFCPIYFALSHTFMTDVPFTVFLLVASTHLWRFQAGARRSDLLIGSAASLIATLSRQLGLAAPLAFAITSLWRDGRHGRMSALRVGRAVLPTIASVVALKGFEAWMNTHGILPELYKSKSTELVKNLADPILAWKYLLTNGFLCLAYLGLFLFPLLWVAAIRLIGCERRFRGSIVVGLVIMILAWFHGTSLWQLHPGRMPFGENILVPSGIGPLTLRDAYLLDLNAGHLPESFWNGVTVVSLVGGGILLGFVIFRLQALWSRSRSGLGDRDRTAFFWVVSLTYLAPLLLAHAFDRYLIPMIPLVVAAILGQPELTAARLERCGTGWRMLPGMVLVAYAIFAIGSTHDYLSWNRARWQAIDQLSGDQQALARRIDGGFEFNGYYAYDPSYRRSPSLSHWWVTRDDWMIAFGPMKGWSVRASVPYSHVLPALSDSIVVLEKNRGD